MQIENENEKTTITKIDYRLLNLSFSTNIRICYYPIIWFMILMSETQPLHLMIFRGQTKAYKWHFLC
jgi:hypothetical protein